MCHKTAGHYGAPCLQIEIMDKSHAAHDPSIRQCAKIVQFFELAQE
jgi:hypothetical protein